MSHSAGIRSYFFYERVINIRNSLPADIDFGTINAFKLIMWTFPDFSGDAVDTYAYISYFVIWVSCTVWFEHPVCPNNLCVLLQFVTHVWLRRTYITIDLQLRTRIVAHTPHFPSAGKPQIGRWSRANINWRICYTTSPVMKWSPVNVYTGWDEVLNISP